MTEPTLATYTVKRGDTLSVLASRLLGAGTSYRVLMQYNPQITNPDLIRVGETIYYPETKTITETTPSQTKSSTQAPVRAGLSLPANAWLYGVAAAIVAASLIFFKPKKS